MIYPPADVDVPVPGGFSTTSHAYREFLDMGGVNAFITDRLADGPISEDVDKSMKVDAQIRDEIMDALLLITQLADVSVPVPGGCNTTPHAYKEFLDKGGLKDFIDNKLADECVYEDVDKLMKIGVEMHDKVPDPPTMISQFVDVDFSALGRFSTTSHANKELLDKGGSTEIINDKLVDEPIYEDVDKLMRVSTESRGKITGPP